MANRGFKQLLPPIGKGDYYDENNVPTVAEFAGGYRIANGDTGGTQTFNVTSDSFVSENAVAVLVAGNLRIAAFSDESGSTDSDKIAVGKNGDNILQTLIKYDVVNAISPSPGGVVYITQELTAGFWLPVLDGKFDYSININSSGNGELSIKAELVTLE